MISIKFGRILTYGAIVSLIGFIILFENFYVYIYIYIYIYILN